VADACTENCSGATCADVFTKQLGKL